MATINAWSASRYNTYTSCPAKAKFKFIDKLQEPSTPALENGLRVHKVAETYVKGEKPVNKFPEELKLHHDLFRKLRNARKRGEFVEVEESYTFRKDWTLTKWNDWNGAWLRVKVDCIGSFKPGHFQVYDWKTGKYRPEDMEDYLLQLELYALAAFLRYDNLIKVVTSNLVYLDTGHVVCNDYTYKDAIALKKAWVKRTVPMLTDQRFAPTPNKWCGYCHFRKDNGGPCRF